MLQQKTEALLSQKTLEHFLSFQEQLRRRCIVTWGQTYHFSRVHPLPSVMAIGQFITHTRQMTKWRGVKFPGSRN